VAEVEARRSGFGDQTALDATENGGLLTFSELAPSSIRIGGARKARGRQQGEHNSTAPVVDQSSPLPARRYLK